MKTETWIAALRSGKYEQGRLSLCSNGQFCCLGVLAEITDVPIMGAEGRTNTGFDDEAGVVYMFPKNDVGYGNSQTTIPYHLWSTYLEDLDLGMMVPGNELHPAGSLHNRLMAMNDEGSSFEEIADFIEGLK